LRTEEPVVVTQDRPKKQFRKRQAKSSQRVSSS